MNRILLDVQSLQGENRHRGIGNYTRELLRELVQNNSSLNFEFLLNDASSLEFSEAFEFLNSITNNPVIHLWSGPHLKGQQEERWATISLRATYEKVSPDLLLIFSYFEGFNNPIQTAITGSTIPTAVIVYDFIPAIFPEAYLTNPSYKSWYQQKLAEIKQADLLLGISESTVSDASSKIGIEIEKLRHIGTGVNQNTEPTATQFENFALYVGGIDWRKNIERLISGFAVSRSAKDGLGLRIVCAVGVEEEKRLVSLAMSAGISEGKFLLTGYLSDEELRETYKQAKFCIFPSLYEGFGLPIIEAMSFGKAVICSNTSSMLEIQEIHDARFDPLSVSAIASAIDKINFDEAFRKMLELESKRAIAKHTWPNVSKRTVEAIKIKLPVEPLTNKTHTKIEKLTLALVTPWPSAQSGIALYSRVLAEHLSEFYEISIVNDQLTNETSSFISEYIDIKDFRSRSKEFDRIVYQLGNSDHHCASLEALSEIPGVVVLHDFYMSGVLQHSEIFGQKQNLWSKHLLQSHGFKALRDKKNAEDISEIVKKYPSNLLIQQQALATISHNPRADLMEQSWIEIPKPNSLKQNLPMIPNFTLRQLEEIDHNALEKWSLTEQSFVIASFGFITHTKGHFEIAGAIKKLLSHGYREVVFLNVGEDQSGHFGQRLNAQIRNLELSEKFRVLGWTTEEDFQKLLRRADVVIQLRKEHNGEGSGALLDAMANGKAIITTNSLVPSKGSDTFLEVLSDDCNSEQIYESLKKLIDDEAYRRELERRARKQYEKYHNPYRIAQHYRDIIENAYFAAPAKILNLISNQDFSELGDLDLQAISTSLSPALEPMPRNRQILVDVSELHLRDVGTGIQRVVRSITRELLSDEELIAIVRPIYLNTRSEKYYYADSIAENLLNLDKTGSDQVEVEMWSGDVYLGVDLTTKNLKLRKDLLHKMNAAGVKTSYVVYDLLPIEFPQYFESGAKETFLHWLDLVRCANSVHCISEATANAYIASLGDDLHKSKQEISVFRLGSDFISNPVILGPKAGTTFLKYLMVGTLEPRKGHAEALDAFEQLWAKNFNISLTIVGNIGWLSQDLQRRLESHVELGSRLFWLRNVGDAQLAKIYQSHDALIAASYGEGYGLPLIESMHYGLICIARDIPVFREVAPRTTIFFDSKNSQLVDQIEMLVTRGPNIQVTIDKNGNSLLNWREATQILKNQVLR